MKNPRTFSEKMQWIKLFGNLETYGRYTDKLDVRDFVKAAVGEKYLVPLLGHWENFEDIQFASLPKRFVLKATHGSGYNFICADKTKLDKGALKTQVDSWIGENFYALFREAQYKHLKPRLICEKYLEDEFGELKDYKICCFNGSPQFVEVHSGRGGEHVVEILDTHWKPLPYESMTKVAHSRTPRPKKFNEMLSIAEKLSDGFPFVRIDLYSVRGRIYFGEMTFTPLEGFPYLGRADDEIGDMLDLSGYGQWRKIRNSKFISILILSMMIIVYVLMGPFTS